MLLPQADHQSGCLATLLSPGLQEDGAPWRKEHAYELAFETFHETRIGYLHH